MISKKFSPKMPMNPSVHNLLMLFVFSFTMFVIYRYIKSLETDLKHVMEKVESIEQKVKLNEFTLDENKETNLDNTPLQTLYEEDKELVCNLNDKLTNRCEQNKNEEDDDDDTESVNSKELIHMINEIDEDDTELQTDINVHSNINKFEKKDADDHETDKGDFTTQTNDTNDANDTKEINLVMKKTVDENAVSQEEKEYMKKTNDELKSMLKDQGKSVKGSKQDLVKRLLNL